MKRWAQLRVLLALVALLAGLWAAACGPQAPPTTPTPVKAVTEPTPKPALIPATASPAKLDVVKIGELGFMAQAPFYIAVDKGYFREQGIDAKLERVQSPVPADVIAPLSTGALHVSGSIVSSGLLSAVARGVEINLIAMTSRSQVPFDINWWMVRTDLKDQVKGFADFKGRTVNMISPGNIGYYALGITLPKYGMSLKDVKLEHMGPPETGGAFEKKAIDISLVVEPNAVFFEEKGIAIRLIQITREVRPIDVGVVLYSGKWAKENPEVANKFAVAYLKGVRDYLSALQKGPNRKEVIDIAIKYTALKDPAAYEKMTWSTVRPDGYVDKDDFKTMQEWFIQNGYQEVRADIDKLVDNSYLDYANQVLGKPKM